jgi:ParB-like chromosome segregation protein Spo0J
LKATPSKVSGDSPNGGGGFDYIAEPLRGLALPISSINQDAANARKHDARNIDAIASSLKRWGQRLPIVVQREGMIVRAGNGRVDAARSLGWSHLAAVVVDEDSVEATAYAIADNRTAELAEWDNETLRSLLDSLDSDLRGVIAFSDSEIETLIPELLQSTPVSEIDCEAFNGQHKCPKCGFEFDD